MRNIKLSIIRTRLRVFEAVDIAKQERCPVVVGVPFDLQKLDWQGWLHEIKTSGCITAPHAPEPDLVTLAAS